MDENWLRKRIRKAGIPSLGYYNKLEVFPHPLWGSFDMMFVTGNCLKSSNPYPVNAQEREATPPDSAGIYVNLI